MPVGRMKRLLENLFSFLLKSLALFPAFVGLIAVVLIAYSCLAPIAAFDRQKAQLQRPEVYQPVAQDILRFWNTHRHGSATLSEGTQSPVRPILISMLPASVQRLHFSSVWITSHSLSLELGGGLAS